MAELFYENRGEKPTIYKIIEWMRVTKIWTKESNDEDDEEQSSWTR